MQNNSSQSWIRTTLFAAMLAAAPFAANAQGGPGRNGHHESPQQHRPAQAQHGSNHQAPSYSFSSQDRAHLQKHYSKVIGHVDRAHRPHFEAGQPIPATYRKWITPAPDSLRRRLPPPPAGYSMGYYQGYTVVYDPVTFAILSVVDLLSQQ